MKTIFKISLCIALFFACQTSHAQLLKRIQEKVENKAEQKAMEEAEKAADKMLDNMLGNKKKEQKNAKKSNDSYTFNQSITVEIETKGNEKAQLDFLFDSKNSNLMCMKLNTEEDASAGEVYAVITPNSSTMFMSMPGMKIKKKVSKEEMGSIDYTSKVPQKSDLVKTGKTKKILGYTCYEYFYENEGGKVHAWVTTDFPIQGKFIPILGMKENGPFEGFVMELQFEGNNEKSSMKVIKLDTNTNIKIDANAYTSM
ncbi:DUF4412 domain-containing protein [uncultured Kordia sp.]|uniref:DUF4412 domain-containing protein n=1 Tax=uncultured Kordia sp. TaxID=507699 RepID=UPI00260860D2|nr:DUF4412 domain-containing protein [uncultured Kordia sp.]